MLKDLQAISKSTKLSEFDSSVQSWLKSRAKSRGVSVNDDTTVDKFSDFLGSNWLALNEKGTLTTSLGFDERISVLYTTTKEGKRISIAHLLPLGGTAWNFDGTVKDSKNKSKTAKGRFVSDNEFLTAAIGKDSHRPTEVYELAQAIALGIFDGVSVQNVARPVRLVDCASDITIGSVEYHEGDTRAVQRSCIIRA